MRKHLIPHFFVFSFFSVFLLDSYSFILVMDEERRFEITRILNSLSLNPFEVFDVPMSSSVDDAQTKYRRLSMRIHPDRCKGALQEDARKAFALLNDAKELLLDDDKRTDLLKKVAASREKLITTLTKAEHEKRKTTAAKQGKRYEIDTDTEPLPDFSETVEDFDMQLRKQLNEDLIFVAWSVKQDMKDRSAMGIKQHKERVAQKAAEEAKVEETKLWEATREERASGWKQFKAVKGVRFCLL